VVLREKDEVEVYCRLFSLDAATDGVKKVEHKFALAAHPNEVYRVSTTRTPHKDGLAELNKKEQGEWWQQRLSHVSFWLF